MNHSAPVCGCAFDLFNPDLLAVATQDMAGGVLITCTHRSYPGGQMAFSKFRIIDVDSPYFAVLSSFIRQISPSITQIHQSEKGRPPFNPCWETCEARPTCDLLLIRA